MTGKRLIPPATSRATQLEQRIRQIESELGEVEGNMRLLRRVVQQPERGDLYQVYRARAATSPAEEPRAVAVVAAKPIAAAGAPANSIESPKGRVAVPARAAPPPGAPSRPELQARDERDYERFANYFTTGSLQGAQPLRRERRKQRNRALFALIILGLVAAWVIRLCMRRFF